MNNRESYMLALLIPIIVPMGIIYSVDISHPLMYIRIAVFALLLLDYVLYRIPVDSFLISVSAYLLLLLVSTFMNSGNYEKYIGILLNTLLPILWCRCSFCRKQGQRLLKKLAYLFTFVAVVDLLLYFIAPNGLSLRQAGELVLRVGLISNDNSIAPYLIPACMLTLFYLVRANKDRLIRDLVLFFWFLFPMVFVFTGVGIISSIISVILFFFFRYSVLFQKIVNFRNVALGIGILFVVFCLFQATNWISIFSEALGSSVTFTGRTDLWIHAKMLISRKPLWGYGVQEHVYMPEYSYRTTPHNMYFQLVLWSGFLGITPLLVLAKKTVKTVMRYWKSSIDIRVLSIGVIGVLVYFLFEVDILLPILWLVISYINYYPLLIKSAEKDTQNKQQKKTFLLGGNES